MLLRLDFQSDTPIYMQIRNEIVLGIAGGALAPGEQLPPIRVLADQAGVNMMTVSKAYQLLKAEGYIQTDRRSGARVHVQPAEGGGEKELAQLRLIAAQAKLAGLSKAAFLELCTKAYEEEEYEEEKEEGEGGYE